jgi:hypothetical protein
LFLLIQLFNKWQFFLERKFVFTFQKFGMNLLLFEGENNVWNERKN